MTDLTHEQLDKARAEEAAERWKCDPHGYGTATLAARLAREGWTPTPPVDPVLLAVREVVARTCMNLKWGPKSIVEIREGGGDDGSNMLCALAAYRAAQSATEARYRDLLRAAKALRADAMLPRTGIGMDTYRNLLLAFDAALSALEQSK